MISMTNWRVSVPRPDRIIGYDGENLVYRLQIETDGTPDWDYMLDLKYESGRRNYISLAFSDGVLWADLRREFLSSGRVMAQIRALRGEQEKHSNWFDLIVEPSINATEEFSDRPPGAFAQLEARLNELLADAEAAAKRAEQAASGAGGEGGGSINLGDIARVTVLDRAEYDALAEKDAKTLYLVKG